MIRREGITTSYGYFEATVGGLVLPWWLVVTTAAAVPAVVLTRHALRARRTQSRRAHLRCTACGYDLRASPDRCPECGARQWHVARDE